MSKFNINVRLARLGRKKVEVIRELRNLGIRVSAAQFSNFTNGLYQSTKSETVLEASDKIISKWENQCNDFAGN